MSGLRQGSGLRRLLIAAALIVLVAGALRLTGVGPDDGDASSTDDTSAVVTAPVERRLLDSVQVTRGTVVSPLQATILAPPPQEGELATVVTALPHVLGDEIAAGSVVVELNGRPVIALPGAIPFFRHIRPGDSGPDVEALQASLEAIGYTIPQQEAAVFGTRSQAAVEDLYAQAGYEARYTLSDKAAVEAALGQANNAVAEAQRALEDAQAAGLDTAAAAQAVSAARTARDNVRSTEGVLVPVQEFLAVPVLPATLVVLTVTDGLSLSSGAVVASIGSPQYQVQVDLSSAQANELTPDVSITVHADDNSYDATCGPGEPTPADDAPPPSSPDGAGSTEGASPEPSASGPGAAYQMNVNCDPLPARDALGSNLRVTMTVHRSQGPVLVVPSTALSTQSTGEAFVQVIEGDGTATRVAVSVGGEAGGFVAVAPVEPGALDDGMDVRVRRG